MPGLEEIGAVPLAEMREALAPLAKGIPLHGRGGVVRAYVMVDAEDWPWLSHFKWYLKTDGYAIRNIRHPLRPGKQAEQQMARLIMGLGFGSPYKVDHIDHDTLNNCRSNLRVVTHAQNHQNRRAEGDRGTSSRFRGVSFRKDKKKRPWHAYGCIDGKLKHLGFFEDEQEAADAAAAWRREHMPFSNN